MSKNYSGSEIQYIVKKINNGQSVKKILKTYMLMSSKLIRKVKSLENIKVNGKIAFLKDKVCKNDVVTADLSCGFGKSDIKSYKSNLNILYEDKWIIAVEKPAGILVHPLTHKENGTLANMIRYHQISLNEEYTVRPVLRLDKNTSGIVIFAKNQYIQHVLQIQRKKGKFTKEYLALAKGNFKTKQGTILKSIARKEGSIIEREVSKDGKPAKTEYKVLRQFDNYALLKIKILTGRTHQIRVHLNFIGHHIIGDGLYNDGNEGEYKDIRQCLHAFKTGFYHPVFKKKITVKCFLPKDIKHLI